MTTAPASGRERSRSTRRALTARFMSVAFVFALAGAAPSLAQDTLASADRPFEVAYSGGELIWGGDALGGLNLRERGTHARVRLTSGQLQYLNAGPDRDGHTVAVYERCTLPAAGVCGGELYTLDLATGTEHQLAQLSLPGWEQSQPAIFRDTLAFVRDAETGFYAATTHGDTCQRHRNDPPSRSNCRLISTGALRFTSRR